MQEVKRICLYLNYQGLKHLFLALLTPLVNRLYLNYEGLKHGCVKEFHFWASGLYLNYEGLKLSEFVPPKVAEQMFIS